VHALLGENGAGKSTLVKCVAGFQRAEEGSILIDGREQDIANPVVARALGIGMVYQHFTLAPGMTVAENLLLAGGKTPARDRLEEQARGAEGVSRDHAVQPRPRRAADPSWPPARSRSWNCSSSCTCKPRLLILDEPTSVLTPQEADEVLGHVRDFARSGPVHRADHHAQVPRGDGLCRQRDGAAPRQGGAPLPRGGHEPGAAGAGHDGWRSMRRLPRRLHHRSRGSPWPTAAPVALKVEGLKAQGDRGTLALHDLSLSVRARRNPRRGRRLRQRPARTGRGAGRAAPAAAGRVSVMGQPYNARRAENRSLKVRSLPEEPLRNACVGDLSVAENMALRDFDQAAPVARRRAELFRWRSRAREWIAEYGVKTQGEGAPIRSLSGGNVQRAVLARELAGDINVLIAANPVFGLDFAAVAEIHARIVQVREKGGAVLLVSEDLDELLELADRIVVMSEGQIVFETSAAGAKRHVIGAHMGGGPPGQGCR
jgi:ABC-type uncharacterized transport system ATPase subunit